METQVGVHLDTDNYELCMIVYGRKFSSGQLYLPDLNLCLAYRSYMALFICFSDQYLVISLARL